MPVRRSGAGRRAWSGPPCGSRLPVRCHAPLRRAVEVRLGKGRWRRALAEGVNYCLPRQFFDFGIKEPDLKLALKGGGRMQYLYDGS